MRLPLRSVLLVALAVTAAATALVWRARSRAPRTPRVVLVITVDTLRADHLGAYGAGPGRSPHLDELAAASVVFEHAYAPAPFTLASMSGLMTSRYPEEVGIASNTSVLGRDVPTLASVLAGHGFRTGAVVSNVALRKKSGIASGFQWFDDQLPQREKVRRHPERTGRATTRAALSMLKELGAFSGERVFAWVHYQDPHGPYTPPPPFDARFAPSSGPALKVNDDESGEGGIPDYQDLGTGDAGVYQARYKGEVAAVDDAIGWLLTEARRRGGLENAMIVFTADHGEGMGEDDYWFAHGERLTEPLVHVPLFVSAPGLAPGRRADDASLLDVFPTIAARLALETPGGLRGRGLLAAGAADASSVVYQSTLDVARVRRRALVVRGVQYLEEERADGTRESVSAFRRGAPPPASALPSLRDRMRAVRADLVRREPGRQTLSPEEVEALRALGYVDTR